MEGKVARLLDGRTVVVFVSIAFDHGAHVPDRLVHRVVTGESFAEGAVTGTHRTSLHVLGPPLQGSNWLAADGPDNDPDNHHRRGIPSDHLADFCERNGAASQGVETNEAALHEWGVGKIRPSRDVGVTGRGHGVIGD